MATEHPIQKYSTAVDELGKARTRINQMQQIIGGVYNALDSPYEFMVSNVSTGFPPEVAMAQGIPRLNANEWPSAQQIAEAVSNLHRKYSQAENAYHALSSTDKGIVNPLPDRK